MTLQDRLSEYLGFKSLTFRDFEKICGLSNGTAARLRITTRKSTFDRIANSCDLNVDWLLTGVGDMLTESPMKTAALRDDKKKVNKVPLIPIPALANSLVEYIGEGVDADKCEKIDSPVNGAEFAIQISGDSMEPMFHDGAFIYIKKINEVAFMPWGNPMVIDTENGVFFKNVFPCKEDATVIEARSINEFYPNLYIPKESIYAMYRVLGVAKIFTTM